MPEPPSEYRVLVHWHRQGSREFRKGYFVIARNPADAVAFGRYRFWKTHVPEISTIDDIQVKQLGVLLHDDGWGAADASGAHGLET
jgi:hypothetical protein